MHQSSEKIFLPRLLAAVLSVATLTPAAAGDLAAARARVQVLCQNCHGMDGVALIPGAANLSGQQKEYLVAQLRAFRAGSRQEAQMSVVAKTLTDADIENLASWYSAVKVRVEMPR
jgi:cytochrome c553